MFPRRLPSTTIATVRWAGALLAAFVVFAGGAYATLKYAPAEYAALVRLLFEEPIAWAMAVPLFVLVTVAFALYYTALRADVDDPIEREA